MADKNILEEQKKAREDFLKLKKMQQGEIAPEPKPSEVAVQPENFKEKMKNFWFYYRWHTIGIILSVMALIILFVQCAKREKFDFEVVYFTYEACMDVQLNGVEDYIEKYTDDVNGDGEVNVSVINCSFSETTDGNYKKAILSKVQAQIVGNKAAVMYVMDDKAHEYLNGVIEGGMFEDKKATFKSDFYEATKTDEFGYLPEGLGIYLRRTKGTNLENDKKVEEVFKACENTIDKIKNEP